MSQPINLDTSANQCLISDHFVYASSQWGMALYCNAISHQLVAYTKWSLFITQCTGYKALYKHRVKIHNFVKKKEMIMMKLVTHNKQLL